MQIYLVGGAVRDRLLGLPVKDRDWVVVGATVEEMLDLGYRQVGRDFPVFLHPQSKEEYALARTERKSGKGYVGFEVFASPSVTLEEDLARRDLSINALAEAEDGTVIDPYGGIQDIEQRTLRHVSPAFAEDPLRVLRVARFAARFAPLGFSVAEDTLELMRDITRQGELQHLVAERIWQETSRALLENSPQVFFQVLRRCDALTVVFPELQQLFGVPQSPDSHPEIDSGEHTLQVLAQAARLSDSLPVRFSALCHDLGKGLTDREHWPQHPGHESAGMAQLEKLGKRLRVPNDCMDLAKLVMLHHGICHRADQADAETLVDLLARLDAYRKPERFEEFLLACEADSRGRGGHEETPYPQADILRRAFSTAAALDTRAIIAAGHSGPAIGTELQRQRIEAIAALSEQQKQGTGAGK